MAPKLAKECKHCGGLLIEHTDGSGQLVCSDCHVVSDRAEFGDCDDAFVATGEFKVHAENVKLKKNVDKTAHLTDEQKALNKLDEAADESRKKDEDDEKPKYSLLELFQKILEIQCRELRRCGKLPDAVERNVRHLWRDFIDRCCYHQSSTPSSSSSSNSSTYGAKRSPDSEILDNKTLALGTPLLPGEPGFDTWLETEATVLATFFGELAKQKGHSLHGYLFGESVTAKKYLCAKKRRGRMSAMESKMMLEEEDMMDIEKLYDLIVEDDLGDPVEVDESEDDSEDEDDDLDDERGRKKDGQKNKPTINAENGEGADVKKVRMYEKSFGKWNITKGQRPETIASGMRLNIHGGRGLYGENLHWFWNLNLALFQAAFLMAQQPVLATDLLAWVRLGYLPYFNLHRLIKETLIRDGKFKTAADKKGDDDRGSENQKTETMIGMTGSTQKVAGETTIVDEETGAVKKKDVDPIKSLKPDFLNPESYKLAGTELRTRHFERSHALLRPAAVPTVEEIDNCLLRFVALMDRTRLLQQMTPAEEIRGKADMVDALRQSGPPKFLALQDKTDIFALYNTVKLPALDLIQHICAEIGIFTKEGEQGENKLVPDTAKQLYTVWRSANPDSQGYKPVVLQGDQPESEGTSENAESEGCGSKNNPSSWSKVSFIHWPVETRKAVQDAKVETLKSTAHALLDAGADDGTIVKAFPHKNIKSPEETSSSSNGFQLIDPRTVFSTLNEAGETTLVSRSDLANQVTEYENRAFWQHKWSEHRREIHGAKTLSPNTPPPQNTTLFFEEALNARHEVVLAAFVLLAANLVIDLDEEIRIIEKEETAGGATTSASANDFVKYHMMTSAYRPDRMKYLRNVCEVEEDGADWFLKEKWSLGWRQPLAWTDLFKPKKGWWRATQTVIDTYDQYLGQTGDVDPALWESCGPESRRKIVEYIASQFGAGMCATGEEKKREKDTCAGFLKMLPQLRQEVSKNPSQARNIEKADEIVGESKKTRTDTFAEKRRQRLDWFQKHAAFPVKPHFRNDEKTDDADVNIPLGYKKWGGTFVEAAKAKTAGIGNPDDDEDEDGDDLDGEVDTNRSKKKRKTDPKSSVQQIYNASLQKLPAHLVATTAALASQVGCAEMELWEAFSKVEDWFVTNILPQLVEEDQQEGHSAVVDLTAKRTEPDSTVLRTMPRKIRNRATEKSGHSVQKATKNPTIAAAAKKRRVRTAAGLSQRPTYD